MTEVHIRKGAGPAPSGVRSAAARLRAAPRPRRAGGLDERHAARRLARGGARPGRAARLGLDGTPVPAVVLFDTHTKRALPVGFGVIAEDQLAERIFTLTAREAEISTGALSRGSSNDQTQPETPAVFGGRLRSVRHE